MNSSQAKVNWGTMTDFPEISVDRFGSLHPAHVDWATTRAFFLTHIDYEILSDVLSKDFLGALTKRMPRRPVFRLFLHEMSFLYLKYWTSMQHFENGEDILALLEYLQGSGKIVLLKTGHTFQLGFPNCGPIAVTALSAGSNIGSVMLLFERCGLDSTRVLYTGDCRLTRKDLEQMSALRGSDGLVKKLDKLYLDTTYCLETVKEFPSREEVTQKLLSNISYYGDIDPALHFDILTPLKVDHLAFLYKLARTVGRKIHMPINMYTMLGNIPEFEDITECVTGPTDRIHYDCRYSCNNIYCGDGKEWGTDFNVFKVTLACDFPYPRDYPSVSIAGAREEFKRWAQDGQSVYSTSGLAIRGVYSSNLSRFEMGRMINFFGVDIKDVVPLRKSPIMSDNELLSLLEMACTQGEIEPEYLKKEPPSSFYDFTHSVARHEGPRGNQHQNQESEEEKSYVWSSDSSEDATNTWTDVTAASIWQFYQSLFPRK